MAEKDKDLEPTNEVKRRILQQQYDNARAEAYAQTIVAQASRAAAQAVGGEAAKTLTEDAATKERQAAIHRAAARRYGELLAALPAPDPEPDTNEEL